MATLPRILLVTKTDFTAPRDGGTLRVSAIVRELMRAGYAVDAVPVRAADGHRRSFTRADRRGHWGSLARVAGETLRVGSLSVARWLSPGAVREIANLLQSHQYAAVVIEYSQLLIYRPLFRGLPKVLDLHNVEFELLSNYASSAKRWPFRLLARYEAARVRKLELSRAAREVDAIVTVSEHDSALLREVTGLPADRIRTAPNGVDEEAFRVTKQADPHPSVVFIAHLGWQPNIDAAQWLARQVWPRLRKAVPDAELRLVGRSPARSVRELEGTDGITVHADVPSTMPYLGAAAVATAPLLAAGGTRLKILEALATGTPVVATSLGALGLEHLADGGGLVLADGPEAFAAALAERLRDRPPAADVRATVVPYRWESALKPLVETVASIAPDGERPIGSPATAPSPSTEGTGAGSGASPTEAEGLR